MSLISWPRRRGAPFVKCLILKLSSPTCSVTGESLAFAGDGPLSNVAVTVSPEESGETERGVKDEAAHTVSKVLRSYSELQSDKMSVFCHIFSFCPQQQSSSLENPVGPNGRVNLFFCDLFKLRINVIFGMIKVNCLRSWNRDSWSPAIKITRHGGE